MGTQSTSYQQPSATFTSLNSQSTNSGPGQQGVLCLIGTSPTGTNVPKLFSNLQTAVQEYGTSVQAGNSYTLEPGLEICFGQTGAFSQLQVICIRAGATQAAASVPQKVGGQTAYAFQARASYAGKNVLTAVVGTSTYFPSLGYYVQSVALYDNAPASATVQENYSGPNPVNISQQINTQSQLMAVTTAGGILTSNDNAMGQAGTYTLVGAVDGVNSTDTDYLNALVLAQGINCDFIAVLAGSAGVRSGVFNHVTAMAGTNQFRQGFVGYPYTGQTVTAVVNQAIADQAGFSSQYMCLLANTGATRLNPVTGLNQVYDGFYWAAALAARKAVFNPAVPLTRQAVQQIISLQEVFSSGNLTSLGSYGIMSLAYLQTNNIVLFDGLTLANPGNYRKENIVAQENRLKDILLAQVGQLIGTADPINDIVAIQAATYGAMQTAVQLQIISGYNNSDINVIQTSSGIFQVNVRYVPRVEISQLNFLLSLSLTIAA